MSDYRSIEVRHRYKGYAVGETLPGGRFSYHDGTDRDAALVRARAFIADRVQRRNSEYLLIDMTHTETVLPQTESPTVEPDSVSESSFSTRPTSGD